MKIKVLRTGSTGNSYCITDKSGQSLIIEAGIPLKYVIGNSDDIVGFIYSHEHRDHAAYKEEYKKAFAFYDIKPNYEINMIGNYNILGFPVLHNIDNKGFIISNKIERKVLFFATDLIYNSMTKVFYEGLFYAMQNINIDLFCIESNYNEYEFKQAIKGDSNVFGVENHLSNYECARFISHLCNRNVVQNILLIHGSNRIGRSISGKKKPILNLIPKANILIANAGTEVIY